MKDGCIQNEGFTEGMLLLAEANLIAVSGTMVFLYLALPQINYFLHFLFVRFRKRMRKNKLKLGVK